jgi:hypothetical protein
MILIRIELAMHSQVLGVFAEKYPSDRMVVNSARFLELCADFAGRIQSN